MKTPEELYQEHYDRVKKALTFQEIDRPPISLGGGVSMNEFMGVPYSHLMTDTLRANVLCLLGTVLLSKGEIDIGGGGNFPGRREMSNPMRLPVRELP